MRGVDPHGAPNAGLPLLESPGLTDGTVAAHTRDVGDVQAIEARQVQLDIEHPADLLPPHGEHVAREASDGGLLDLSEGGAALDEFGLVLLGRDLEDGDEPPTVAGVGAVARLQPPKQGGKKRGEAGRQERGHNEVPSAARRVDDDCANVFVHDIDAELLAELGQGLSGNHTAHRRAEQNGFLLDLDVGLDHGHQCCDCRVRVEPRTQVVNAADQHVVPGQRGHERHELLVAPGKDARNRHEVLAVVGREVNHLDRHVRRSLPPAELSLQPTRRSLGRGHGASPFR